MKKIFIISIVTFVLVFFINSYARSEVIRSYFNDKALNLDEYRDEYSFWAGGHLYGFPNSRKVIPASTFVANIDMINSSDGLFFITLGDIFQKPEKLEIYNYKKIAEKIKIPLFNAPGNHDLLDKRDVYKENFGKTFYSFKYNTELYVFMDTELTGGKLQEKELNFLFSLFEHALENEEIINIFIFSHRLIWVFNPGYEMLLNYVNNKEGYEEIKDFTEKIMPHISCLAKEKNVYWLSGDIGLPWSIPFIYDQNEEGITYVAAGCGDAATDILIRVDIKNRGEIVKFNAISLTGLELESFENYNLHYWKSYLQDMPTKEPQISQEYIPTKELQINKEDSYSNVKSRYNETKTKFILISIILLLIGFILIILRFYTITKKQNE